MDRKMQLALVTGIFLLAVSIPLSSAQTATDKEKPITVTDETYNLRINTKGVISNVDYFVEYSGIRIYLKGASLGMLSSNTIEEILPNKYKYSINVTKIPKEIEAFGFRITSTHGVVRNNDGLPQILVETGEYNIIYDFSDILYLNPNITDTEVILYPETFKEQKLEFDPTITFTTDQVEGVDVAAVGNNQIAIAWCDEVANDIYFRTYYTNGSAISAEVTVDSSISSCFYAYKNVGITPINDSWIAVAYADLADNDATIAIYDINGNVMLSPTDIDTDMDYITAISIAAFNDTYLIVAWENGTTGTPPNNAIEFGVFDMSGNSVIATQTVDEIIGLRVTDKGPASIDVTAMNDTVAVISWHDDIESDASFRIYDSSGNLLVNTVDVDTSVGGANSFCAAATAAFDESNFVFVWSDNGASNVKYATYDTAGNAGTGAIVESLRYEGVGSAESVSVTTLNSSWFAVSYHDNEGTVAVEVFDSSGNQHATRVNVTSASEVLVDYESITSTFCNSDISLCDNNIIITYANATVGNFTTYGPELGSWDGTCSPSITANETSPNLYDPIEYGDSVHVSITASDSDYDLVEVNCTVDAINGTRYLDNENATVDGNIWNSSSFTVYIEGSTGITCIAKDSSSQTETISWNFTTFIFTGESDIANSTWSAAKYDSDTTTVNIEIGNIGDYNLSHCNLSFTNSLGAGASYSISDINITNTTNRTITATISIGSPGVDAAATFTINCTSNVTNDYSNDTVTGTLTIYSSVGGGGGPAGGTGSTIVINQTAELTGPTIEDWFSTPGYAFEAFLLTPFLGPMPLLVFVMFLGSGIYVIGAVTKKKGRVTNQEIAIIAIVLIAGSFMVFQATERGESFLIDGTNIYNAIGNWVSGAFGNTIASVMNAPNWGREAMDQTVFSYYE